MSFNLDGCGKTGIRTLGTRKGTTVFETVPIDHSGIFPCGIYVWSKWRFLWFADAKVVIVVFMCNFFEGFLSLKSQLPAIPGNSHRLGCREDATRAVVRSPGGGGMEGLVEVLCVEGGYLVEGDFVGLVVEVTVGGVFYGEHLLVVTFEFGKGVFSEVVGVCFVAVHDQDCVFKLVGIFKKFEVDEGEDRCGVPAVVGVAAALMVAARCLVVCVIVFDKLGSIVGQGVDDAAGALVGAVKIVGCSLCGQRGPGGVALPGVVVGVKVAVGADACHVIHRRGDGRFHSRVVDGCLNGDSAPSADAEYADAAGVDVGSCREIVDGGREVFDVDVGRGYASGHPAALAGKGGVEGDGQKSALGELLGVKAARLLLDGAEGAAHGDGGQRGGGAFGFVKVGGEGDPIPVDKCDFCMVNFVALGEYFVPLLSHVERLCRGE